MNYQEMKKKLKKALDKERYEHTKGVMYTAASMAMAHGYSIEQSMIAGLLHDCAKCIPNDEKLTLCEKHQILVTSAETENPSLLHSKLGALLAELEYDITDPEILHAIKVHTTGEPGMSVLDKIIFIADYIEPGRDKAPNLDKVRKIAFVDLNACMAQILRDTLIYLKQGNEVIDPTTEMTYEFYKQYEEDNEHDI
ncbi:MAG: bis(5'-nucleosyl)-tetraphosphatase (symmetrical) YqeK [Lachnospiraceae bacterium]|nr:bis(5'-nucleosyl)-tetraphosphatase (symmetrical) YqeK [Lachnospiraceae bacterium]